MNRAQLEKVYYIKQEIKMWTDELIEIEAQSEAKAQPTYVIGGRSTLTSDSTGTQAIRRAEVKGIIEKKLQECIDAVGEIMAYIATIDDPILTMIVYMRCVRCDSWNNVAAKVGGGNSADSVRMKFNRAFPKE